VAGVVHQALKTNATTLHQSGPDAFSNMFDVVLEFPNSFMSFAVTNDLFGVKGMIRGETISDLEEKMIVRCTSVALPEISPNTTQISYKGRAITRPIAGASGENTITLTFRVDAYYSVYLALLKWLGLYHNPELGYSSGRGVTDGESGVAPTLGHGQVHISALAVPIRHSITSSNFLSGGLLSGDELPFTMPGVTLGAMVPQGTKTDKRNPRIMKILNGLTSVDSSPIMFWSFAGLYPLSVSNPEYGHGKDEVVTCTVKFAFTKWRSPATTSLNSQGPGLDFTAGFSVGVGESIW